MLDISARMSSKTLECVYSKDFPLNEIYLYREYFDVIRKARSNIIQQEPFAGTVSMAMDYIISDVYKGKEIKTAATDGEVIVFAPQHLKESIFIETQATVEHETWHVGLLHPFRVGKRKHKLANVAADYSVNGIMLDRYPQIVEWGWLWDEKLSRMSFEAVYDILNKDKEKPPEDGDGDGGQGKSDNPTPGDSPPTEQDPKDWENAQQGQFIEASGPKGEALKPEEMKEKMEAHKEFLNNTRAVSVACGYEGAGEADRHITKITTPKINWKVDISRFVGKKGKRDGVNPMKFCRQKLRNGIYYPSPKKKQEINLGIGLDVSSSMDVDSLNLLIAAMEDIRKGNNIKNIEIVPFTTTVNKKNIVNVLKGEKMPKKFSGWGGTRFRPVFEYFNKKKDVPNMVIIFTDLGSKDYGDKPKYPVMWASSYPAVSYPTYTNVPPFGRVVEIEP